MKEVLEFIQTQKQEFARLPLFAFLANQNNYLEQRLTFAPLLSPLAVGLSDLNKYVIRDSYSNNKVQELINKYTYNQNYYWQDYLEYLEEVGFNQSMTYGDFRLVWGEETKKTRSLCSVLEGYAWKASPIQKLVLVEALEGTAQVFFEAALAVVKELQPITQKESVDFGGGYGGLENYHILNAPEMLQLLAEIKLTNAECQAALELAQNVFELFTEAMNELFRHSQTNSCKTVLQISSISAFAHCAIDCLDIC